MDYFYENECPVCRNSKGRKKYNIRYYSNKVLDLLGINKPYPRVIIKVCEVCSHNYSSPMLKEDFMFKYYNKLNSHFYDKSNIPEKDDLEQEHLKIFYLIKQIFKNKTGKILEIGCGYGYLLKKFKTEGWEAYGVEPSPHASRIARLVNNISVTNGYIEDLKGMSNTFDVVILFDVIEHISNANKMIKNIENLLKPGGILIFGTGNCDSINAKLNGSTWAYYSTWEHVSFFNKKSSVHLLENNGFNLLKIKTTSHRGSFNKNMINFIKNILLYKPLNIFNPLISNIPYLRDKYKYKNFIRNKVSFSELCFDHMIVIAKKLLS